jgi:hypothetical protein
LRPDGPFLRGALTRDLRTPGFFYRACSIRERALGRYYGTLSNFYRILALGSDYGALGNRFFRALSCYLRAFSSNDRAVGRFLRKNCRFTFLIEDTEQIIF